ncbi:MAG: Holliday junction resolvase [Acidobacteria bacterium]|nr:Holliday junction resolvase [Acidobacteriota bacterium]
MIAAFDLSASCSGWCIGEAGGPVETGSFRLPPFREDIGGLLLAHSRWLDGFLKGDQIKLVAFEKPVRPFAALNLETARKLYGLAGVLEMECARRGIPARQVSNTEAKKLCYGNGGLKSAEAKKVAVPRAQLWGFDPKGHDEADACAVWLVAVKHWHPEEFKAWEACRRAAGAEAGETLL